MDQTPPANIARSGTDMASARANRFVALRFTGGERKEELDVRSQETRETMVLDFLDYADGVVSGSAFGRPRWYWVGVSAIGGCS
jgi:hypothetical protein